MLGECLCEEHIVLAMQKLWRIAGFNTVEPSAAPTNIPLTDEGGLMQRQGLSASNMQSSETPIV